MERRKAESLGVILARFLAQNGLQTPLNQRRLMAKWPEVVGEAVAAKTQELHIRNQTLYVRITSPALRTQLLMQRTNLVAELNRRVGAQVIADLRFL